jgi:hypothetical protein
MVATDPLDLLAGKLRVLLKDAANALGMHRETLREMAVEREEFTVLRNQAGSRQGRRIYLVPDEIRVFAQGGVESLREYRSQSRRRRTPR